MKKLIKYVSYFLRAKLVLKIVVDLDRYHFHTKNQNEDYSTRTISRLGQTNTNGPEYYETAEVSFSISKSSQKKSQRGIEV